MVFCVQAFKDLLKMHGGSQRNDNEILTLMLEIYKAHKKMKAVSQKESPFSSAMVDAYKAYADGKVFLPENVNYFDSANKFCVNLTNGLKNQEKQQQQTGQKQTLEELALKNLAASLSKVSMSLPATTSAGNQFGNQTPTGAKSVAAPPKTTPTMPVPVNTSITPTSSAIATTTSSTTISSTSATTITPVMSRPRGRPPGSKNSTSKSDAAKNAAMQQKLMASILQPFAGSLSNLELITAKMEPSVKSTVLALLAEPEFMKVSSTFT